MLFYRLRLTTYAAAKAPLFDLYSRHRKKIHCILGMKDPVIIAMSPDKANMSYWAKERGIVEETFAPLAAKLCNEPKCPKLSSSVGNVKSVHQYMTFSSPLLKHEFTSRYLHGL